jgi:branched-chain amino acid transport system ATP-binding protein
MMTPPPLLKMERAEVVYDRAIVAIQDVSLTVFPRQIVAILGANGAGKTTTLRAISGFGGTNDGRVTKGTITYKGTRIENCQPEDMIRQGIVIVPERDKVFQNLSVEQNLFVGVRRVSPGQQRRLDALVFQYFPRLADLRHREAGLLSGGERQMLAIGSALVCAPELLLVDELSMGLAPVVVEDLARRLVEIRRQLDITIVLVEQNAAVALEIADHGYVLENGRVVLEAPRDQLVQDANIRDYYLGQSQSGVRRSYRELTQGRPKRRWYA